jgi:hypothetical protein
VYDQSNELGSQLQIGQLLAWSISSSVGLRTIISLTVGIVLLSFLIRSYDQRLHVLWPDIIAIRRGLEMSFPIFSVATGNQLDFWIS